jgi:O-antigen ligase
MSANGQIAGCAALALMAVYLWALPTAHTIALRQVAFFSLILLTLWSTWRYGLRLHLPLAAPWLIFGAVALASLTYAVDLTFSLGEIKKEIGYGMLVLVLSASWVRNIASLERLIIILAIGNIFLIGSVLFKITILDPFWHHPASQISSLLYNGPGKSLYNGVGNFSTYLVTIMPLIAAYAFSLPKSRRVARLSLFVLLAFNVVALFLTGNRMGLVICLLEILFVTGFLIARGIISWRTLIVAVMALATIGILTWGQMHVRTPVDDIRWKMWSWIITDIRTNPLAGGGFGRTVLCLYDPKFCQVFPFEHAHNMLLDKGVQMGIPGIAAFLFLLGATFHSLWPSRKTYPNPQWGYLLGAATMFVGVFLKSMTDDFFVDHNALLFWALTGGVLGALAEQRVDTKAQN